MSAIGYRGGIMSLADGSFLARASTTLVLGLAMQTALLVAWMVFFNRKLLADIAAAWRQSLVAGFMGAFASQGWFIAFALTNAANVRTLGLVEVLFAQAMSKKLFAQDSSPREKLGMAMIVGGVALLLWAAVR